MENREMWEKIGAFRAALIAQKEPPKPPGGVDYEERARQEADFLNHRGKKDPECPVCRDKGMIYVARGRHLKARFCECYYRKKAERDMERCGMTDRLRRCRFENFRAEEPWQQEMRQMGLAFLERARQVLGTCGTCGAAVGTCGAAVDGVGTVAECPGGENREAPCGAATDDVGVMAECLGEEGGGGAGEEAGRAPAVAAGTRRPGGDVMREVEEEVRRIFFGRAEDFGGEAPKVAERLRALDWLTKVYRMDPAEREKGALERRKQLLAERKQRAEERLAAAQAAAEAARGGLGAPGKPGAARREEEGWQRVEIVPVRVLEEEE